MIFDLDKIQSATAFAEDLVDSKVDGSNEDTMKSVSDKIFRKIIFRNDSYLKVMSNANFYRVLKYVMKASVVFVVLSIVLSKWFCNNLFALPFLFPIIWAAFVIIINTLEFLGAYSFFKTMTNRHEINHFAKVNISFRFIVQCNVASFGLLFLYAVLHSVLPCFFYGLLYCKKNLEDELAVAASRIEGFVIDSVNELVSTLNWMSLLSLVLYVGAVLLFILFCIGFYRYVVSHQSEIFSVVYDSSNSGMDETIGSNGLTVVKSDGSIVPVDPSASRIVFVRGAVFIVQVDTYDLQRSFSESEVSKIVIDGVNVHRELHFNSVTREWT